MDLVPPTTPKGLVAFFNIFPALIVSIYAPTRAWLTPLDQSRMASDIQGQDTVRSSGRVLHLCQLARYRRTPSLVPPGCLLTKQTIAFSASLYPRLFGIALASLSSGLGELTFLQMTTTLPTLASSRTALGAWSSGTGFAGIAGAGLWWVLRGLGVKGGLGISSVSQTK
jgi:battenin